MDEYTNQPYYADIPNNGIEVDQLVPYKRARSNSAAMIAVGLLIGFGIALLISWAMVNNNYWLWANCYVETRNCGPQDYYENPGNAIMNGATASEILRVVPSPDGFLLYNRYQKNSLCVSGPNQTVPIPYPQFCELTNDQGYTAKVNNGGTLFSRSYDLVGVNAVDGSPITVEDGQTYPNFGINCTLPTGGVLVQTDNGDILFDNSNTSTRPLADWTPGTLTVAG